MESVKENKLQEEVHSLFNQLAEFKKNANWEQYISEEGINDRRTSCVFLFIGILLGAILATNHYAPEFFLNLTNNPRAVVQVILLFSYFLGAVILWNSWGMLRVVFQDQTESFLRRIGQVAHAEVGLFETLDQYSTESIDYVAKRLELSSAQAQKSTGLIVGALEKVGFIPGIIATGFALDKALTSTEFSGLEFFSIAIVLIYMLMMSLAMAANRFRQYSFVLVQYLELKRGYAKSKT